MLKLDRRGEVNTSSCGQKMTIIRYHHANDIDVEFEDGTIVTGKKYSNFKIGNISNPNVEDNLKNMRAKKEHEGEVSTNQSGFVMTLVRYGNAKDCDVMFEDGTIVRHRYYTAFKNGVIAHPDHNLKNARTYLIGEKNTALNGMEMTIIGYASDFPGAVIVEFEDGYQTTVRSSAFLKGEVKNPNVSPYQKTANERIGKVFLCKNGLHFTVTGYEGTHKVSGMFEDGEKVQRTDWSSICAGTVGHPELSSSRHCVYKNIAAKFAWREEDRSYYTCRCQNCGKEAIWTPQEMIMHAQECQRTIPSCTA